MRAGLASASIPAARAETTTCGRRSDLPARFRQSYHEVPDRPGLATDRQLLGLVVASVGTDREV
jgi:hypothetical protein